MVRGQALLWVKQLPMTYFVMFTQSCCEVHACAAEHFLTSITAPHFIGIQLSPGIALSCSEMGVTLPSISSM